jgi:hypothetical protein
MFYKTAKLRNMLSRLEKRSSAAKAGVNLVKALLGSGAQTGIKAIPKTLGAVAPKIEGALGGAAAKAEKAFFPSPGGGMSLGVNPKGALHLPSAEELKRSGQDAWHALDSTASPRTPFSGSGFASIKPIPKPPNISTGSAAEDFIRNLNNQNNNQRPMLLSLPTVKPPLAPTVKPSLVRNTSPAVDAADAADQAAYHAMMARSGMGRPTPLMGTKLPSPIATPAAREVGTHTSDEINQIISQAFPKRSYGQDPFEFISPFKRSWEQFDKFSHDQRFREKRAIAALIGPLFRAASRAPLTTAAAGLGGMAGYEFARQPKKLANPALLPNASTAPSPNNDAALQKTSLDRQILGALLRR